MLAGAAMFVGVIFLFARSLSGPSGASTPEGAVESLADAISGEDMAGALAAIAPDEASGVIKTFSSAVSGSDATSDISASLSDLGSLDLEIEGLSLTSRVLGPGLVQVEISQGTLSWTMPDSQSARMLTAAASAVGVAQSGSADFADLSEAMQLEGSSAHPGERLYVIVRELSRGWFLSPLYTAAEYAAQLLNLPGGNFAGNIESLTTGAATPNDAFNDLLAAARSGPAALLNHIAGTSLPVLRSYEPAVASLVSDLGATDAILLIETTASPTFFGDDAYAKLTLGVTSVGVANRNSEDVDYFDFDGTCLSCFDTGLERLTDLLGVNTAYVIAEQTPNGWIISPLATAAAYVAQMLQAIEVNPLAASFDQWQLVIPDGVVSVGDTVNVLVNDYGFGVYSVHLEAGQAIHVSAREEFGEQASAYLVDPAGSGLLEVSADFHAASSPLVRSYEASEG